MKAILQLPASRTFWMAWPLFLTVLILLIPVSRNLEYEFAWFLSLGFALLSPWLAWVFPRFALQDIKFWEKSFLYPAVILIIPSMLYLTGLCPCSARSTYFWYVLLSLPAWWIGLGLASLVQSYPKRLWAALGLAGVQLFSLLSAAAIMWFLPQKRLIHVFFGFIHGPIYDSWLPIDGSIIWTRFSHAVFGLGLICLTHGLRQKNFRYKLGIAAISVGVLGMMSSWFLPSTSHGIDALSRLLPLKKEAEFFRLHYRNDKDNKNYEDEIQHLFLETRFHVMELRAILGDDAPHVEVFVYPDQDQKKLWFGGGGTDITDVVTPSIHIIARTAPHPTLRHELVHALSSHFAFHGLGFHPNMALTEGLAVALAPHRRSRSLDEATAAMLHQNRLPPLGELMSPMFWTQSGARAYTAAGSLLQYLIRNYGMEPVKAIYAGKRPESLSNKSWQEVIAEWQDELLRRHPSKQDLESESLYRYQGILHDLCPQSKATNSQSNGNFWTSIRQASGWRAKQDYWPWRFQLEADDIFVRLQYYRRLAYQAVTQFDYLALDQLEQDLQNQAQWPPRTIEDVELTLLASDIKNFLQNHQAIEILNDLMSITAEDLIGPDLTRQIWARRLILDSPLPNEYQRQWLGYLASWQPMPQLPAENEPAPWIINYLRNFRWRGEDPEKLLASQLPPELEKILPQSFFEMWYLHIGFRLADSKKWLFAGDALQKALSYSQKGSQEKTAELLRMMQHFHSNPL
ncbi:MAG: hypothetical protein ACOH5I_02230 [Oligoflexus sp.]